MQHDCETEWQNEGIFEGGRRPTKGCSGTKGEMIRQNIEDLEWIMRTERSITSIGKERMILLINSSNFKRRLPFCRGILQFLTTKNQKRLESTLEYKVKARKERDGSRIICLGLKERKICVNVDSFSPCYCFFRLSFAGYQTKWTWTRIAIIPQSSAWACSTSKCNLQQHCMGHLNWTTRSLADEIAFNRVYTWHPTDSQKKEEKRGKRFACYLPP